jgi:hypothetical protein
MLIIMDLVFAAAWTGCGKGPVQRDPATVLTELERAFAMKSFLLKR